jgi:hypothetical protein
MRASFATHGAGRAVNQLAPASKTPTFCEIKLLTILGLLSPWIATRMLHIWESMTKRAKLFTAVASALLGVVFAAVLAFAYLHAGSTRSANTDEKRYQQWGRPIDSYKRVVFLESRLPAWLSKALHLPALKQHYQDTNQEIEKALVASGYLTNLHVAVTNARAARTQIAARLQKATTQENPPKLLFFIPANDVVVFICRPQDVALCVRAAEGK